MGLILNVNETTTPVKQEQCYSRVHGTHLLYRIDLFIAEGNSLMSLGLKTSHFAMFTKRPSGGPCMMERTQMVEHLCHHSCTGHEKSNLIANTPFYNTTGLKYQVRHGWLTR